MEIIFYDSKEKITVSN